MCEHVAFYSAIGGGMATNAMTLLKEQAQQAEEQAQLAFLAAQKELQGYYMQVEQIEKYRLDYCRKLSAQGQAGLTASGYSHLNRFISQLDETLKQQRQAATDFEENVERCREYWFFCQKKRRSLEWLLEKKEKERRLFVEKKEQKQMDEFTNIMYFRSKKNFS